MKLARLLPILTVLILGCTKSKSIEELPKPKLIVFINMDHFRHDFLSRFSEYFVSDGLNSLLRNGASFDDCKYLQATTHTAVGHSVMVSGTYPYKTGIVANDWYSAANRRTVYSVSDSSVRIVGAELRTDLMASSPRNFIGSTIGDQLKLHTNGRARVFSVSNKDRAAVCMGGRMADAAYWVDDDLGEIVTSTYYTDRYADWVNSYRIEKPLTRWMGEQWTLSLPEEKYPPASEHQKSHYDVRYGMGFTFPHAIGSKDGIPDKAYFNALRSSPYGAEAILDFTEHLIREENLGKDEVTDLLCVSISVTDRVAHEYGPMSAELMDAVIKTDRYLSSFFRFVDNQVGSKHVLYVLTADHGGAPIPEILMDEGIEAGRIHPDSVRFFIEKVMRRKFGVSNEEYVLAINDPNIYLNETMLSEKNIDKNIAEEYIAQSVKAEFQAIYRVYRAADIVTGSMIPDMISQQVVRSYFPGRSGDLIVVLKPFFIWDWDGKGTDHGQPYSYDTHVPLVFAGTPWIKPGLYAESCSPADIAPTLSEILHIEFPAGTDGRILGRALNGIR